MKWTADKKVLSWAMYDWANSAFSTTVMAGFFPVFFQKYWGMGADSTLTTARLGTTITVASLLLAFLSPTLGALADLSGKKKMFTFIFMCLGVVSCAAMAFIGAGDWMTAALSYAVAQIGFNASSMFYDGLLPSIAPGRKADQASSLGFGLGYLGGGVLLTLNVIMLKNPQWFAAVESEGKVLAIKASFLSVAVWWILFSLPLFLYVPEAASRSKKSVFLLTHEAIKKLWSTFRHLVKEKNTLIFLIAFWLYIDGVYTVMTMAVDFGISIGLDQNHLITALLLVQYIGFPAAIVYGQLAKRWGCRVPILTCIVAYGIAVVFATEMKESWHFFCLAAVIGLVQGGVQALSRSMFSRMIPPSASGEYFGIFNLVGKFASIFGPLMVGFGAYLTGDPRKGMLGLLVLFVIGGSLLFAVKEPQFEG
jgi:MFS transporter, UMF1 family